MGIFSKRKKALSVGLGVGVAGALVMLIRHGFKHYQRARIPDEISPAVFATRLITTAHGEMIYHVSGKGEPIVFLHGVYPGASSYEWSRIYPRYTSGYEVIAPDLIGFGESERPRRALDAQAHAQSIRQFLHEVCEERRPTIVASGVSAQAALLLASQHPESVSRLILWLPIGVARPIRSGKAHRMLGIGHVPILRSMVWKNYLSKPAFIRAWLEQVGFENPKDVDDEIVHVLSTCANLSGADRAIWAFLKRRLVANLGNQLANITTPVSILWPQESALFPLKEAEAILQRLNRGKLVCIPKRGLLAPLADPDLFFETINAELRQN